MKLFELHGIEKKFSVRKSGVFSSKKQIYALKDINLDIYQGETLGVVGESGCGKSTLGKIITGIHTAESGKLLWQGKDLSTADKQTKDQYRSKIQAVFQDPYSSFNPTLTILEILQEPLNVRFSLSTHEKNRRIEEVLSRVGIDPGLTGRYPRAFSGGQRQRISIARALLGEPDFLLCDEPISALDVSIQAQIMNLLAELKDEMRITMLFISHNISMVRHISDRIAVMYLGRIVELGTAEDVVNFPKHPYTKKLLSSILPPYVQKEVITTEEMEEELPSASSVPPGCPYHPRCPHCMPICDKQFPSNFHIANTEVACHLYDQSTTTVSRNGKD